MKKLYILFLILFFFNQAFSQNHSSLAYQSLADSLFEHRNYRDAATYYQKALKNSSQQGEIMLRIATSYTKINKIKDAEVWYQQAEASHASFTDEDIYQYVNVLMMIEKRSTAQQLLLNLLKDDPESSYTKKILDDLLDYKKYYQDSLAYKVFPLSINTPLSEFAPAFYKDGIVFSSAQPEHLIKKKYHYDNTHFLNLYYSAKIKDTVFQKPVLFENDFNARFHDGPATFYANGKKMILNRNQLISTAGKRDLKFWHLGLYDGLYMTEKSNWQLTLLPFSKDASYSLAHPSVSADGNILYFISDKPGGFGGTDIYRVTKTNGVWGEPLNLGSIINTPGNEEFPFFNNNTLYFASNGRGGLGGLDIFKCEQTVNGYSEPINLGYPVNTNLDDFSFITTQDGKSGYFSSARNGSDDLFTYSKRPEFVKMLAHIYDGQTKDNLSGATIQIISDSGFDTTMYSNEAGLINFQLEKETTYIIIGSKDGKTGMLSGFAISDEDHLHITHQISAYGDTTRIPCVGLIQNELGVSQTPSQVIIKDEKSNKVIAHNVENSMISFLGVKGHTYHIEIQNEIGDTTTHQLKLDLNESGSKTWTMALKELPKKIDMAAHIFQADNKQNIDGAQVKIITFAEADQELVSDANGMVEFTLANGAAYILMTDKGNLTGMHSGIAEPGTDKAIIVHQVPMQGDPRKLPVAILVTDKDGNVVEQFDAHVTDNATGKEIELVMNDGVLTFQSERGKEYDINVEKSNYKSVTQKISIPTDASDIEKVNISLLEKELIQYHMAARVFKASDKSPLAEAQVRIITFSEEDQELITNDEGIVDFILPEGTAYVVMGSRDGLTGMHAGVVEPGTDKTSVIHPVAAEGDFKNKLPVFGLIADQAGEVLTDSHVIVTEKTTGQKVPVQFHDGILTFYGDKGKDYIISVEHKDYLANSKQISIPVTETAIDDLIITLQRNPLLPSHYAMAARVFKAVDNTPLAGAQVKIITFDERDQELVANKDGIVEFTIPQGTAYVVMGSKDGLTGMHSGVAEPGTDKTSIIHPVPAQGDPHLPIIARIEDTSGKALDEAKVTVTEKTTGQKIPIQLHDGILSFDGEKGKDYIITVNSNGYAQATKALNIPIEEVSVEKFTITLEKIVPPPVTYTMAARVFKASDNTVLAGAQVSIITFSEADQELVANSKGIVEFKLLEGTPYVVMGSRDGLTGMHSGIAIAGTDKNSVIHPVAARGDLKSKLPVFGLIADKLGDLLVDSKVTITEKSTGQKIPVQFHDGILTFYGDKGKDYIVNVEHENYRTASKNISIPLTEKGVEDFIINLEKNPVSYTIASQVVKSDNTPLADAKVKVITFSKPAQELITNKDGIVEFNLDEGTPYVIVGSKGELLGSNAGIAKAGSDKNSIVHPVKVNDEHKNQLPVFGLIADKEGNVLIDSKVIVTEKTTGEKIPVQFHDGILTFYGDKGKDYIVTVDHQDYRTASKQLSIPLTETSVEDFIINLEKESLPEVSSTITARVVKADNTPLADADVKVITFSKPDQKLTTNKEGIVDFKLNKGTPYIIVSNKDGLTGTTSGIAGSDSSSVIKTVTTNATHKNQLPIFGLIADKAGDVLIDSKVTVTEKYTGQKIPVQFHDGILTFYGDKGKEYIVTVDHEDYHTASKKVVIPISSNDVDNFIINLEKTSVEQPALYTMAARVFKASDNTQLSGANVKIITFSEADQDLIANNDGIVEFTLREGTPYVVMGSKDGLTGMHSGIVSQGNDKTYVTHAVAAQGDHKNQLPVFGLVADEAGEVLTESQVIITEKSSGKEISAQYHDGILTFYGDKGKDYIITVSDKNYHTAFKQVSIPLSDTRVENIIITLKKNSAQVTKYTIAARVLRASDNVALAGAAVKIITFSETDQELVTNNDGIVEFILTEGTAYVLLASKDGLTGMYADVAASGSDKASMIHTVLAQGDVEGSVSLLGFISAENGQYLSEPKISITDEITGQKTDFTNVMGIVAFTGMKGHTYKVQASATGFPTQTKIIKVDENSPEAIQWQLKLIEGLDLSDKLVLFDNLTEPKRIFLVRNKKTFEVIEKEGALYLKSAADTRQVCAGTLPALLADPKAFVNELGIESSAIVQIKNIYFDFDKALLDEKDKVELNKIASLLQDNADWEVQISTHADDRGRENYNQRLSEKRAISILKYLNTRNVAQRRLLSKAHGESMPAVTCPTDSCSEEEHQKNRRAEFNLLLKEIPSNVVNKAAPKKKNIQTISTSNSSTIKTKLYTEADSIGDKQLTGLVFKINIGAYRYNANLEFLNLKDLGSVESVHIEGLTYYFLSGYATLNKAREMKKKVVERGITDASVSIYYNGKKISFETFQSL